MVQDKDQDSLKFVYPRKDWPARLQAMLVVLLMLFFAAALIVILKNDLVNKKIQETEELFLDYIGNQGFVLDDIIVTGRQRTSVEDLRKVIRLKRGDNFLRADVQQLKQDLEQLPWVRDVSVRRHFFPNILQVTIFEREVMALWQLSERFYPIDTDGYVIEADYRPDKEILLVVGAGAPENVISFFKLVEKVTPQFLPRIKAANYISKRRWNIVLDDIRNGITVKLPEEKVDEALKKLSKLDSEKGIFKRKLTIIDLRLEDKVTVKLRKSKIKPVKKEQGI